MQVRSKSTLNQKLAGVQTASAYARLGGAPAVRSVVDVFYQRVLADDQLVSYFDGLDSGQLARVKRHQIELISHVLGGPIQYPVETLRATHAGLKIQPACSPAHIQQMERFASGRTECQARLARG